MKGECIMKFTLAHNEMHVFDLEKSLKFYEQALGLKEVRRYTADDGSFILVFLSDEVSPHLVELTWNRDRDKPYDLGENEIHLAFKVDDFEGAYEMHKEMGLIEYENKQMGVYFIVDPDGYWMEVMANK
jgi:lactoylglutathione lyase